MLNLLRFNSHDDGESRFNTYAGKVMPVLAECGAELVYSGTAGATVIGDETWDRIIIVRYPNKTAVLAMLASDAYQAIAHQRAGALLDSRLVMTIPDDRV